MFMFRLLGGSVRLATRERATGRKRSLGGDGDRCRAAFLARRSATVASVAGASSIACAISHCSAAPTPKRAGARSPCACGRERADLPVVVEVADGGGYAGTDCCCGGRKCRCGRSNEHPLLVAG